MAKEIERKFLVASDAWRSMAVKASRLRQFYVATAQDRSAHIRISDDTSARLTLKFGVHARIRDEFEYDLPLPDAEDMEQFAMGRVIEKTRSIVEHAGHTCEIDEFAGELTGRVVAEPETPDEVPDADLPAWLGREVTGDPRYYNATLALRGLPEIRA